MNIRKKILSLEEKAYKDSVSQDDALFILQLDNSNIFDLIASSNNIRLKYKGKKINLCSIVNAKSGSCGEDCAFCPQSSHNSSEIVKYSIMDEDKIVKSSYEAKEKNAQKFGIVTSGKSVNEEVELNKILSSISKISEGMHCCASLGILTAKKALKLKSAGLREYHHNLETAKSFFPSICSTHAYKENVDTVKIAKEAGLRVCCGGIFGMGESLSQRVEFAFDLKELDVDSIPLNFLNPIKGTRLENRKRLTPFEVLKIIAMFRFVHPKKDIKAAGGREVSLRDLQSLMFAAGANSTMVGNYLTTKGRAHADDIQLISDLELEIF